MLVMTFVLALCYWVLLAVVIGTEIGGSVIISEVHATLPVVGSVTVSGPVAGIIALGLPGLLCILAGGALLYLRLRAQRQATDRVLVPVEA